MSANKVSVAIVACAMLAGSGQVWAADKGKALTLCKNQVAEKYGEVSKQRLKKFRAGGKVVVLRVFPKNGEPVNVDCRVKGNEVVSITTKEEREALALQN